MRSIFIEELVKAAKKNKKIFLIVGDLGFNVVEKFSDQFPDRFLNVGVAEQNMMGLASGIASEGMHVFVYSIANFPTFRCAEQIRNDLDCHNLPVTIVAVGGGVSYGNLGYSHHAVQDYALMRIMPNILISSPGDALETKASVKYLTDNPQPSYIRLDKSDETKHHHKLPGIKPGKWIKILPSKNSKIFLTTGNTIHIAKDFVKNKKFKDYGIYTLPLWGMKIKKFQPIQVKKFKRIVSIEDHLKDAGFGSWLVESIENKCPNTQISTMGLNNNIFDKVADQKTLNAIGGLRLK